MKTSYFVNLKLDGENCVNYLMRNIKEDGSFVYCVNIKTQKVSGKYNLLRHAGTLYELCIWLNSFPNQSLLQKLEKPFRFLINQIKPWKNDSCVVENNEAKLGGSALTLLALISYYRLVKDNMLILYMEKLANFLLFCQNSDGSFVSKFYYENQLKANFRSGYYPGQAVLALIEFYSIDPSSCWLHSAYLGVNNFLNKPITNSTARGAVEHWFSKALFKLLKFKYDEKIESKLNEVVDANLYFLSKIRNQNISNSRYFTSASLACAGEALISGLRFYMLIDDSKKVVKVKKELQKVLAFCLSLQINEERNSLKARYNGGIVKSIYNQHIRIDYVQHCLSVVASMLTINPEFSNASYNLYK